NGDVRALPGKERGDGAANAAVAAGDKGHFALQPARTAIARLPVRLRIERAFVAGQAVLVDHLDGIAHRTSSRFSDRLRQPTCSGLPLRLVCASSSNSFLSMDSYMEREAPLRALLDVSPRLADKAAPAAFCCALDLAGMTT